MYVYILLEKTIETFALRVSEHFKPKLSYKPKPKISYIKFTKIAEIAELYQVYLYNFMCQNVRIFPNYILLTRRINKVCNKDFDLNQAFICPEMC